MNPAYGTGFPLVSESVDELMATARRGNRMSVGKLVQVLMQDIGRYKSEILDALVSQLRPDVLTMVIQVLNSGKTLPPHLLYAKDTGSMAISAVYMASLGCAKRPEEKEATVAILRRNMSTILTWILIDLGQRPGSIDTRKRVEDEEPSFVLHSGLLRGVMDLDPRLEQDVLSSSVAADIALVFWSTLTEGSKPLYLPHQKFRIREAGCAIIDVVRRFVRAGTRDHPPLIIQRLSEPSSACDESVFLQRLYARVENLNTLARTRHDTMNYLKILESCRGLAEVTHHLILAGTKGAKLNALLYCTLISTLTRARVDEGVQDQYLERVVDLFLFVFSEWVLRSSPEFQKTPSESLSKCGVLSSISKSSHPSIYPVAAKTARKEIIRSPEWAIQGRPHPGVKTPFTEVRSQMLELAADMKSRYETISHKLPICDNLSASHLLLFPWCHLNDNLQHHELENELTFIDSKACSHCQSVVYCSKRCQKQDWVARHRLECENLRQDYKQQKVEERRYRQRLRVHHMGLASRHFHRSLGGQADPLTEHAPMVCLVYLHVFPLQSRYQNIDAYVLEKRALVPEHLRRRFDDLLAIAKSQDTEENSVFPYRLLHAEVRFGRENVCILGTIASKDALDWSGGPRIRSSMIFSRTVSYDEEPPLTVPQVEPMKLPQHLLKD
ncbi:hypothetical protein NMY22_g1497 [Coprinellus aureogranulatus]|nr:hypothetical protein NMY22_g1497 [Coprinellus aureogranulatus]